MKRWGVRKLYNPPLSQKLDKVNNNKSKQWLPSFIEILNHCKTCQVMEIIQSLHRYASHPLWVWRGKTLYCQTNNQIVNNFIITTRACNVYVKKTMLTGDAFINDISHLAKVWHHLHNNFNHDKNLWSNLTPMEHHHMKSPNSTIRTQLGY